MSQDNTPPAMIQYASIPGPRGLVVYVERVGPHSRRFVLIGPHRSYTWLRTCGSVSAALTLAQRYARRFC